MLANQPTIFPSLNLDFINTQVLDPRISFSRNSIATRFNSVGILEVVGNNQPRFDYDPVTFASRGLLIEESRANLFTYSEDFTNEVWIKSSVTIGSNTVVAPDGTLTADKIVSFNGTGVSQRLYRTNANTTTEQTLTFYLKYAGIQYIAIGYSNTGAYNATFDILNGVITSNPTVGGMTASISPAGNGWYRCQYSGIISGTQPGVTFAPTSGSTVITTTSFVGDGVIGVYIWGAQLEAGSFATSYIPTVASQVTRAADTASIDTLTPWYNPIESTVFAEFDITGYAKTAASTFAAIVRFDDNNSAALFPERLSASATNATDPTKLYCYAAVRSANTEVTSFYGYSTSGQFVENTVIKTVLAAKANDFAFRQGTLTTQTDSSGNMPTSQVRFLLGTSTANWLNGHLRRIAYYQSRLSNNQIQVMTSS